MDRTSYCYAVDGSGGLCAIYSRQLGYDESLIVLMMRNRQSTIPLSNIIEECDRVFPGLQIAWWCNKILQVRELSLTINGTRTSLSRIHKAGRLSFPTFCNSESGGTRQKQMQKIIYLQVISFTFLAANRADQICLLLFLPLSLSTHTRMYVCTFLSFDQSCSAEYAEYCGGNPLYYFAYSPLVLPPPPPLSHLLINIYIVFQDKKKRENHIHIYIHTREFYFRNRIIGRENTAFPYPFGHPCMAYNHLRLRNHTQIVRTV